MPETIPFKTAYNYPATKPYAIGDGTEPIFQEIIEDGQRVLTEVGRSPLFDIVQASKDECDIYKILNRYENGDESVLTKTNGVFADVVGMPTNLAEVKNVIIRAENQFNALPVDVKEKFGNNVNEYLTAIATADFKVVEKDIVKDEVIENVEK